LIGSLIVAALFVASPTHPAGSCQIQHVRGHVAADRRCTPGLVVKGNSYAACKAYNRTPRHVTVTMRKTVFRWYGIPYAEHARYEVDHLEPRFACGADDVRNLWPEPGASPNVKDKDELRWYAALRDGRKAVKQVQRHFLGWSR
jgi:hypothetical protein